MELYHHGTPYYSGRYPWGSGENPYQRNRSFLQAVEEAKRKGLTEAQIAEGFDMTTTQLRALKSIAKNEQKQADIAKAVRYKDKGMSNVAIGERMGINESSVRALLKDAESDRLDILQTTSGMLKDQIEKNGYIDIGAGVERHIGVSDTKLGTAVAMLKEEGYTIHYVKVEQLGTGKYTTIKVLAKPDTPYSEVYKNRDKITYPNAHTEDSGRTYLGLETPAPVSSKRVGIRYAEDGGAEADGVIYVRRGVDDVALGSSSYAQVRISIDGTHYLKGMAVYSDDLPDGVDLLFNTNKKRTGNPLDAMKAMKDDPDNPFGSMVRQRYFVDKDGKRRLSAMNIVNEEGDWHEWSRSLSSQVLSKQSSKLAKEQLKLRLDAKRAEYDEIMSLTNPTIRKKLLDSFADDADSSAVHLKAAALPRQSTHVILPIPGIKNNEIYAPNFRDGERVALIRYPHGGKFEIPELTVNNKNAPAKKTLGRAKDAVGIHHTVAERMSGADFDGDTVLVIPNNSGKVKTSPPLRGLKDFDPQRAYPAYDGMKPMSARAKQMQMGDVSNLITDMTIRGATPTELARAVRHSMVVIDAEKHKLNYKQSYQDNSIADLKKKYQGRSNAGASTLISKASSVERVNERKPRSYKEGGPVDPETGRRVWEETGESYVNKKGQVVRKTQVSTRMAEVDDARSLSSGTPIEEIYATHANQLKALANQARKSSMATPSLKYNPSAKKVHAAEVATLTAKLNTAYKNKPLERRAQILANTVVEQKRKANPNMDAAEVKKVKAQALAEARSRTGAAKQVVEITEKEWAAIQAGAISNHRLRDILDNADLERVKTMATPRSAKQVTGARLSRAKSMLNAGYTQSEVADALGVSVSTINKAVN